MVAGAHHIAKHVTDGTASVDLSAFKDRNVTVVLVDEPYIDREVTFRKAMEHLPKDQRRELTATIRPR